MKLEKLSPANFLTIIANFRIVGSISNHQGFFAIEFWHLLTENSEFFFKTDTTYIIFRQGIYLFTYLRTTHSLTEKKLYSILASYYCSKFRKKSIGKSVLEQY